ncbi:hypothetical protein D3C79_586360 [compost metagenome]
MLLLFSNEISEEGSNLSFAVEFGKIVARLDLLAQMLDERYRRIGLNYAQSLLLMNFLPGHQARELKATCGNPS